jgi:hypothetical protein
MTECLETIPTAEGAMSQSLLFLLYMNNARTIYAILQQRQGEGED